VYGDNLVESNETFNIGLSLPPFLDLRIKVDDKNSIEGYIIDSTGKSSLYTIIYNFCSKYVEYIVLHSLFVIDYIFLVTASITKNPNSLTVVYLNDSITLLCKATASGNVLYQWRRNNGKMIDSKAIGVNTPTLTIPSVTQDDEDEYYCTASYGVYANGTSHVAESERAKVVVFGMNII